MGSCSASAARARRRNPPRRYAAPLPRGDDFLLPSLEGWPQAGVGSCSGSAARRDDETHPAATRHPSREGMIFYSPPSEGRPQAGVGTPLLGGVARRAGVGSCSGSEFPAVRDDETHLLELGRIETLFDPAATRHPSQEGMIFYSPPWRGGRRPGWVLPSLEGWPEGPGSAFLNSSVAECAADSRARLLRNLPTPPCYAAPLPPISKRGLIFYSPPWRGGRRPGWVLPSLEGWPQAGVGTPLLGGVAAGRGGFPLRSASGAAVRDDETHPNRYAAPLPRGDGESVCLLIKYIWRGFGGCLAFMDEKWSGG